MRKLIINADDLGMSPEQNKQIRQCIELGVITSSTLMANGPFFQEGVEIAKRYPQISVGVHLNIIEFAPLTNSNIFKKYGIVNTDGNFIEGAIFCVSINDELRQAIFEEWDAQILKIEQAGIIPTHCDSHQHTHTIEALQGVLCQVLEKHHIKKVRRKMIPSIRLMLRARKQPDTVHLDKSKAMQPKKRNVLYRRFHVFVVKYYSWRWNRRMSSRFFTTDSFYSFRDYYTNKDILHLGGNNSFVELMCHPGHPAFQTETDNMVKDKTWLGENTVLTSYHEL